MPVRLEKDELLAEVLGYLRAESRPRKAWRRRIWLGRRAAFARLDSFVYAHWAYHFRKSDQERHHFVASVLEILEQMGAFDALSAGRWAEEHLPDPVGATEVKAPKTWGVSTPQDGVTPPRQRPW